MHLPGLAELAVRFTVGSVGSVRLLVVASGEGPRTPGRACLVCFLNWLDLDGSGVGQDGDGHVRQGV